VSSALAAPPTSEPNSAPVANAGADRTAKVGSPVTLAGTGTDADTDPLSYQWTQTGGTPTVALTNSGTRATTFTAPPVPSGKKTISLTFTLSVTDDSGATGSDSVVVKVVRK
jgi:PKD domain